MSQIKLKHSGGNSVIIAAPDSNPASDRTLKLPSDGDGTILTTNTAVGKILQVKSATKTDTASINSKTFADISDLTVTLITPQSGSKVLVSCDLMLGSEDGNTAAFKLFRDSTAIGVSTQATGNMTNVTFGVGLDSGNFVFHAASVGYQILDTHGADGSTNVVYKLQWSRQSNSSRTLYINRSHQTDDQSYTLYGTSTITAIEVAA